VLLALAAYFTRDYWLPESDGLQNVVVSQREIELVLTDIGNAVDGDRIQISVNGKVILEDHTLTGEGTVIPISLSKRRNEVEILALNEGSSSPNTVEVSVSHVIEGPSVQVSSGLHTGEIEKFNIKAPWW